MKRKQFIKISGKSLVGLAFLSHLPTNSVAHTIDNMSTNNGGAMIEVKTKRLFLQDTWTISRNSSDYKDNVFVRIEKDGITGYGEAAPNVRYGEDHQKTTDRINSMKGLFDKNDLWHYVDLKDQIFAGITDQNHPVRFKLLIYRLKKIRGTLIVDRGEKKYHFRMNIGKLLTNFNTGAIWIQVDRKT